MLSRRGTITKTAFAGALGLAALIAGPSSAGAQQSRDPLTRFIDNLLKGERAQEPAPAAEEAPAPQPPSSGRPSKAGSKSTAKAVPAPDAAQGQAVVPQDAVAAAPPLPPRRPAESYAAAGEVAVPVVRKPASAVEAVALTQPSSQAVPNSPAAALDRVNTFFNTIDQMTANFSQESATGQKTEGSLYIKRPGQLRFAYSPPSTLEIVSDGRSVAIRDKKLGTNDVYSVNQTPLKFLVQEQFNLARDTNVRDVQIRSDGVVMVSFEDSATLGGTSKVTLLFDARANKLRQWVIIDAQGFRTSVTLSDVNVVQRAAQASQ